MGSFDRAIMADNLRKCRVFSNLSLESVGESVGCDPSTISNYEQGKYIPTYETMWALADLYGVSIDDLGGRNGSIELKRELVIGAAS